MISGLFIIKVLIPGKIKKILIFSLASCGQAIYNQVMKGNIHHHVGVWIRNPPGLAGIQGRSQKGRLK